MRFNSLLLRHAYDRVLLINQSNGEIVQIISINLARLLRRREKKSQSSHLFVRLKNERNSTLYLLIAVHLLPAPVELFSASWTRFRDEIKIVKKKEKRKVKREISKKKKVPWVTFQRSWTMFNLILPFFCCFLLSLSISRWFLVAAWNCHFLRFVFCSSSMWSERQPLTSRLSHSLRPEHIFNLKILHTWDFTER